DAERGHALAAPGLAHHAQRLALVDVEVDPVDGAYDALVGDEVRLESSYVQEPFGHGASSDTSRYCFWVNSRNASSARWMSSASMSLWVTQRMAAGPIAWIFTLRAAQPATSASVAFTDCARSPLFTRRITMLVCTLARSISIPGSFASPSASARALAWSWARRSTMRSSATTPAAATMPACPMPA